jgi:signal peptidase
VKRLGTHLATLGLVMVTLLAVAFVLPSLLGYERYVITGKSMTGTYDKGSVVFEHTVPAADLQVGDVITYLPPASSGVRNLVTHRIVSIGHDDLGRRVLRTKGDHNPDPDPWRFSLTSSQQPVVAYSVPYAGFAIIALADRHTRMLVVGLPAALVALASLVQLAKALRTRETPPLRSVAGTTGF